MAALPTTNITTTLVGNAIGSSSRDVGTLHQHENVNRFGWGSGAGGDRDRNWGKYSPSVAPSSAPSWEIRDVPYKLGAFRGYQHDWAYLKFKRLFLSGLNLSYRSEIVNKEQAISFNIPTNETILVNYTVYQRWFSASTSNWRQIGGNRNVTLNIKTVNESVLLPWTDYYIAESDIYVRINSVTDAHGGYRFKNNYPPSTLQYPSELLIETNTDEFVGLPATGGGFQDDYWYIKSKINTTNQGFGYASITGFQFSQSFAWIDNTGNIDIWMVNYGTLVADGSVRIELKGEDGVWHQLSVTDAITNYIIAAPIEEAGQLQSGVFSHKYGIEFDMAEASQYLAVGEVYEMRVIVVNANNNWDNVGLDAPYENDVINGSVVINRPCRGYWKQS